MLEPDIEPFAELVQRPDVEVPLAETALAAAALLQGRPPDIEAGQAELEAIAARCDETTLAGLARHLCGPERFRGNRDDYYDPANSYLDEVLRRRTGIPITLSILAIGVGGRIGVPLVGIALPGHFVVRAATEETAFCDLFDGGAMLGPAGCEERVRRLQGATLFDPAWLQPASSHATVARLLANLLAIHARRGNREELIRVLWLRTVVPGVPLGERRDLAAALGSSGRFDEAAAVLDQLAVLAADAGDDALAADAARDALRQRARTN